MFTKQFTILSILVTVFVFAMSIVGALAVREASTTYDVGGIFAGLSELAFLSADKIQFQEDAMAAWTAEATDEVFFALENTAAGCEFVEGVILGDPE